MSATLFTNARIIDPSRDMDERGAVLVAEGRIIASGASALNQGAPGGASIVNCYGKVIMPGLVDTPRVHWRTGIRIPRDNRFGRTCGGGRRRHVHRDDA